MPDVAPIIEHLHRARAGLASAANRVPRDLWRKPPRPDAWSAAEVIAHLIMVEGKITDGATRLVKGAAPGIPFWKRLHLPVRLAEWRGFRVRSPIPLDVTLLTEKEAMLARLTEVRQRTLELLEKNRDRELSAYRWRHPFFGSLNFYEWFRVVAHHELRHAKQIREIVESFQE
jgi:hypothetical protein